MAQQSEEFLAKYDEYKNMSDGELEALPQQDLKYHLSTITQATFDSHIAAVKAEIAIKKAKLKNMEHAGSEAAKRGEVVGLESKVQDMGSLASGLETTYARAGQGISSAHTRYIERKRQRDPAWVHEPGDMFLDAYEEAKSRQITPIEAKAQQDELVEGKPIYGFSKDVEIAARK